MRASNFLAMAYRYKHYFISACIETRVSALTVKINSPDKENTLLCREFKAHYATNNGRDHCSVWFSQNPRQLLAINMISWIDLFTVSCTMLIGQ